MRGEQAPPPAQVTPPVASSQNSPGHNGSGDTAMPSLLEIGKRAAMLAEREAIERVLAQTRWNRRQAAKILRISYKALLNKLKAIEENNKSNISNTTV
jgi:two-component system response regulator AtoC